LLSRAQSSRTLVSIASMLKTLSRSLFLSLFLSLSLSLS
jgi:hypothetical protein